MPQFSFLPFRRRSFSLPLRLALLLITASAPPTRAADPRGDALTAPLLPSVRGAPRRGHPALRAPRSRFRDFSPALAAARFLATPVFPPVPQSPD
jgi:hypothetical protein